MTKPKHIIYIHIPKTGGTSFHNSLAQNYAKERRYHVNGMSPRKDINNFLELPASEAVKYDLVYGHLAYGIHQPIADDYRYLSIIREPVSRVVSYYNYAKRSKHHYLHQQIRDMSFTEFINSDITSELKNGQLRLLASDSGHDFKGDITAEHLQMVLNRQDQGTLVLGDIKKLDEFIVYLQCTLFPDFDFRYITRNATRSGLNKSGISETDLKKVREMNALDIALYDEVIDRAKSLQAKVDGFEKHLDTVITQNEQYQKHYRYSFQYFWDYLKKIRRDNFLIYND